MTKDKLYFIIAFIKTLSASKIFNAFLLRLSYFLSVLTSKHIHWGTMESLSVEPINKCNLHCPECAIGSNKIQRKSPSLQFADFKKIIDETYKKLIYLQLYFQGEPFIHSHIYDFIRYAVNKKVFVSTSTNGHFLSPTNSAKIVESGLHQVIISIDGTTQAIFSKYRKGGDLNTVLQGVKNLQQAKKDANSLFPHIAIQFVVLKYNEHQIPEVKQLCKQLKVKDLRLKTAQIYNLKQGDELVPIQNIYSRYTKQQTGEYKLKRRKIFHCFRVWSGAVISSEMALLPCCFDKSAIYKYGSVKTQPIHTQWKNQIAKQFRQKVWKNQNKPYICKNCSEGLTNKILLKH